MCLLKMNRSIGVVLLKTHSCRQVVSFLRHFNSFVQKSKYSSSTLGPFNLHSNCSNSRKSLYLNQSGLYNMCSASCHLQSLGTDEEIETRISAEPTLKLKAFKQARFLLSKLEDEKCRASQVKPEDWDTIRSSVLEIGDSIDEKNIDAVVIAKCSEISALLLGKSYFKYLKSGSRQINRATYGNYLRLFYICSADCTSDDLNEITAVYTELTQAFPLLDYYTAEKAVSALSLTKLWREYENLFKVINMSYAPSASTYSAVIIAAFKNKELELGWSLIKEIGFQNPPDDIFMFWLQIAKDEKRGDYLQRLLTFFNDFNLKPSLNLCEAIKTTFEGIREDVKGTFTSITRRGECKTCKANLDPAIVSKEEYEELKAAFLDPVLIGKDIFQKTRPEEFREFIDFLEKTAPYDIVLDGLNIALKVHKSKKSTSVFIFQLNSVVRHFASMNKKILILGRKHMMKWLGKSMKHLHNNAEIFLAEDISQDDPFLLYAALYSGLGTCFVSQDLMRGHKFLLANPKLKATFLKWQSQHQYFLIYIEDNGTARFQEPVPFMQTIQQNSQGDWHIPYFLKENLTGKHKVDNFHRHWLCVHNQRSGQPTNFTQQKFRPTHHKKRKINFADIFND